MLGLWESILFDMQRPTKNLSRMFGSRFGSPIAGYRAGRMATKGVLDSKVIYRSCVLGEIMGFNGGLIVDEMKKGATNATVDADGFTWVYAPPISIEVKEFSAFIPKQGRGFDKEFLPFATLRFDCLKNSDCLLVGLDKIMELLNCSFPDNPFFGLEESFADMMEYGSEPWVYHLRDLMMEAEAQMLMLKLRWVEKTQSPDGYRFNGYVIEDIFTLLREG